MHTCACVRSHMHTHMHAHTHTCAHTRTYGYVHTQTQTQTHTHRHTHTYAHYCCNLLCIFIHLALCNYNVLSSLIFKFLSPICHSDKGGILINQKIKLNWSVIKRTSKLIANLHYIDH